MAQFTTDLLENPVFKENSPALSFELHTGPADSASRAAEDGLYQARASTVYLPHRALRTPAFMPVGTKGTIKGLSSSQLLNEECLNPEIILGNTYHLALQPTTPLLKSLGGLHSFMQVSILMM
jgi:tRNA-guanine family transglycosylase